MPCMTFPCLLKENIWLVIYIDDFAPERRSLQQSLLLCGSKTRLHEAPDDLLADKRRGNPINCPRNATVNGD